MSQQPFNMKSLCAGILVGVVSGLLVAVFGAFLFPKQVVGVLALPEDNTDWLAFAEEFVSIQPIAVFGWENWRFNYRSNLIQEGFDPSVAQKLTCEIFGFDDAIIAVKPIGPCAFETSLLLQDDSLDGLRKPAIVRLCIEGVRCKEISASFEISL